MRPGENVVRELVRTAVLPFEDLLGGNEFVEELDHEVFVVVVMDDVLQVFVLLTFDVLHGLDRLYYGNGERIVKMDYVRNPVLIPIVWVQRGKGHWVVDMPRRRYVGQEGL